MPHKAGKREETRKRILEAAGRGFRGHGYAGIGVDGVAREAGVTSGAFYAHFGSKDAAFRMALESGLDEVIEAIPRYRREHGPQWIDAFAAYYLSEAHREDLACGCAMTTLTPEVARADEEVHRVFETKMAVIADLIADGLAGGSREDRRRRAWSVLGVLTGGLNLARAMASPDMAREVAEAIRAAAVQAAGET